ncbi:MAG: hypothetical protein FJ288_14590 [Planctomycetes bacterium]|nr:hypothetical protein [Planctomycetota bacterium]
MTGATPRAAGWRVCAGRFCALCLAAAMAAPALADRIITKSGETFTGTIVEQTAEKVVLRTLSGTMTIPRDALKSIEKAGEETPGPAAPQQVVPAAVDAAGAAKALRDARSAVVAGEWVKAAGLLEGLMLLDEKSLSPDDRLGATGALVTCYLQIKDAQGAARSLSRRALLAPDAGDKRRLLAAAEVLKAVGSTDIGGKTLTRFDEVVEAAMNWKAQALLKEAVDSGTKAKGINDPSQLDRAANAALKKLAEADVFVPGFSAAHRRDPLAALVGNIMDAATQTVEYCEKERPELTRTAAASVRSIAAAKAWNDRAAPYFARRQAAEDALKNLDPFAKKFDVPDLCKTNEATAKSLLAKLDDLQYYPEGTVFPYGWYGHTYTPGHRIKMQLRRF